MNPSRPSTEEPGAGWPGADFWHCPRSRRSVPLAPPLDVGNTPNCQAGGEETPAVPADKPKTDVNKKSDDTKKPDAESKKK